jgi:hypothetical protein
VSEHGTVVRGGAAVRTPGAAAVDATVRRPQAAVPPEPSPDPVAKAAPGDRVRACVEFAELAVHRARRLAVEAQACRERAEALRRQVDARRQRTLSQERRV